MRGMSSTKIRDMDKDNNPRALTELFENNRQWVASVTGDDPDFFLRLVAQHL